MGQHAPRAKLSRNLATADAIRLMAEHHIVHVRRAKNGEIVAIKHMAFGWIGPKEYYLLQEAHRLIPEFVRGGYQAKAWLWSVQLSVAGFSIPVGGSIPAYAVSKIALALSENDTKTVGEYGAALLLPWGDVWILMRMLLDAVGVTQVLKDKGADIGFFGLIGYVLAHPELGDTLRRLVPF
jgi:hypothetical protein